MKLMVGAILAKLPSTTPSSQAGTTELELSGGSAIGGEGEHARGNGDSGMQGAVGPRNLVAGIGQPAPGIEGPALFAGGTAAVVGIPMGSSVEASGWEVGLAWGNRDEEGALGRTSPWITWVGRGQTPFGVDARIRKLKMPIFEDEDFEIIRQQFPNSHLEDKVSYWTGSNDRIVTYFRRRKKGNQSDNQLQEY